MSVAKPKPRTLDEFRSNHDRNVIVPAKINAALAKMREIGPEHYEYESDFIKFAGISQTDVSLHRDSFADHIVETTAVGGRSPRRVWFGDKKVAAKVR